MFRKTLKTEKRVLVTTDVHGCYEKLMRLLARENFSDEDILVIAGDSVDRGPDSRKVLEFIRDNDNVICLRGNHEDMLIKMLGIGDPKHIEHACINGGSWVLDDHDSGELLEIMESFPWILTIEKGGKKFGVVHAEPDSEDWDTIGTVRPINLLWARTRLSYGNVNQIANVEEVYVGHTIVDAPTYTGNVLHMDMGVFCSDKELYCVTV